MDALVKALMESDAYPDFLCEAAPYRCRHADEVRQRSGVNAKAAEALGVRLRDDPLYHIAFWKPCRTHHGQAILRQTLRFGHAILLPCPECRERSLTKTRDRVARWRKANPDKAKQQTNAAVTKHRAAGRRDAV